MGSSGGKGGPKVIGGMTAQEYQQMLDKQNTMAKEAETERQRNLLAYEEQRRKSERDQILLAKAQEEQKMAEQRQAEEEVSGELQAQNMSLDQMDEEEKQRLSEMFSSLYSGQQTQKPD
jgi:membrane protein involved in colicin uptake